jgi:uncharacterized membrane protein SirB2
MPYTAFLHTHETLVGLYVLFFIIKLVMLFRNDPEKLIRFRKKTKMVEMILPTLFLITGIYLAANSPYATQNWFIVKMVLIVLAIVLGIITFKKNSKVLGVLTLLIFLAIFPLSYQKSKLVPENKTAVNAEGQKFQPGTAGYDQMEHGKFLYTKALACTGCHGENGSLGNSGAFDLSKSTLTDEEIMNVIKNGRKLMPAYGSQLDEYQLKALTAYVKSLRK